MARAGLKFLWASLTMEDQSKKGCLHWRVLSMVSFIVCLGNKWSINNTHRFLREHFWMMLVERSYAWSPLHYHQEKASPGWLTSGISSSYLHGVDTPLQHPRALESSLTLSLQNRVAFSTARETVAVIEWERCHPPSTHTWINLNKTSLRSYLLFYSCHSATPRPCI